MEHSGKHALVTGGGTGIGLAIARALAHAGARVTITGRNAHALRTAAESHPNLHPLVMDVTDEAAVRSGIAAAADRHGPVSICIANAGIAEGVAFRKMTLAQWRATQTTNLDGVFLTLQAAMATLGRDDWGRMIAISSIAGVRGLRGAVHYTASKHGVIGLIRGLSEEYMGSNITFNALCPGYVDTPIVTRNAAAISTQSGITAEQATDALARANRHKKLLEVDEIAAAALWLCSQGARSVNGQSIQIAGGQVS